MNTQNPINIFLSLVICLFLISTEVLKADEINYPDSWDKQGYSIISQSQEGVKINYSITSFNLAKVQINGKTLDAIKLPGSYLPNNEGAPDIPGTGRLIAIPQGSKVSVIIIKSRTETFTGIDLAPAPVIPFQTETGTLQYFFDESIYNSNKFYPENPVLISDPFKIRGIDVVKLGITPFLYNPVTKELIVYRDIKIEVKFKDGNGQFGENRLRSKWWDPLFENMFLNYESLPDIDYNSTLNSNSKDEGAEYLIISPNGAEFQQWADSIRNFRTLQGILTRVATLDEIGGNTATLIENYINDAYFTWDIPPVAVLCLGDYGTDPANSIIAPIWQNYCVSDNIYADVDGDEMPDIIAARMCAQNASELETMVTKFLDNERNPPTDPNFYHNPITSCSFSLGSWNQLMTESVAGFYEVILGKNTNRINVGPNPIPDVWSTAPNAEMLINYFGPDGLGYIPATPGEVNCSWNSTALDVVDGINDGAFMLLHRGPAYEQGWMEPNFTNNHVEDLTNTNPTFVWSVNCLTGKFNYAVDCLAEKFHRHTSGALGVVAASEISYTFLNDVYAWGAFDNMWPDFLPDFGTTPSADGVLPAFANAAGKYFLLQSSWPYNPPNKEVVYNIFHYFGDAFSTVYTEIPQELSVSHASWILQGTATFEVTANEGSLIALSVNGELIGKVYGTGAPVSIEIPPQYPPDEILVTVTKQNYYRYEALVPVGTGTGLTDITVQDYINVYPNPATDKLFIEFPENTNTIYLTLLNVLNEDIYNETLKIENGKPINIDLTNLVDGIYFLYIQSGEASYLKKIIINK